MQPAETRRDAVPRRCSAGQGSARGGGERDGGESKGPPWHGKRRRTWPRCGERNTDGRKEEGRNWVGCAESTAGVLGILGLAGDTQGLVVQVSPTLPFKTRAALSVWVVSRKQPIHLLFHLRIWVMRKWLARLQQETPPAAHCNAGSVWEGTCSPRSSRFPTWHFPGLRL